MNNKLLISALFAMVSGCSTTYSTAPLVAGTGSGSSGTAQKPTAQAVPSNTYPSYSSKSSFPANITDDSNLSSGISKKNTQPRYSPDRGNLHTVKSRAQESVAILTPSQSIRSEKISDPYSLSTKKFKVELIRTNSNDKVYLQLGVFSSLANAKMLQKKVAANQMPEPVIKEIILNGKLAHRVQLGPILSTAKVNEFNAKLMKIGISETWYVTENKN